MKKLNLNSKIVILISAFLISSNHLYSQWTIVGTLDGIQGPIPRVCVVDENTAFVTGGVVASGNATYKTTNGGMNWIRLNTDTCSPFYAIWSNDGRTLFAGDNGGVDIGGSGGTTYFYQNLNDRAVWTVIDSIPPIISPFSGFKEIRFSTSIPSFGIAYTPGDNTDVYIYKTRDGGNKWEKTLLPGYPPDYYASNGFCVIDSLFYAFSTHFGPPSIIITTDGGVTWNLRGTGLPSDNGNKGRGLAFKNNKLTGIAGSNSTRDIARTTDGGLTWVTIQVGNITSHSLGPVMRWIEGTDICYMTCKASDIGGLNKGVFKSTNGGLNWTAMETDGVGIITMDIKRIGSNIYGYAISFGPVYGGNLVLKFSDVITGINQISELVSDVYFLSQNYPNPFNPVTVIRYSLLVNRLVTLKVFDVLGNEVATLVNEKQNAGSYEVDFDGSNFSSGVYFYELAVDGNIIDTKRMVLLK